MFSIRPISYELKKIWTTSDGNCYDEEPEAKCSQLQLDFEEWYQGFGETLYGLSSSGAVHSGDLLEWILDNRKVVQKLLHVTSYPST